MLSVLKRQAPQQPNRICPQGEATLEVGGRLNLTADQVDIGGVDGVSVLAGRFDLSAREARARFHRLHVLGDRVSAGLRNLAVMARRLETTAGRAMERFGRYYRRVEEFEDIRAGRIRLWVRDLFAVKSKATAINAEDRVQVDADKILLG